jgi:uncharacterized protein
VNPFFFGDSRRQLFGVYEAARGRSERGVVLCYPWAREYLLAHPTMRVLAQRLSEAGWHSLRFDYYGTGDSAGDAAEISQQQWLSDVSMAIEELKEMAPVREIALVGMRYGATIAALAVAQRSDVSRLVLWDPVADGKRYLAELGATATNGADLDVMGSVLTRKMREELEAITPAAFARRLPRTLLLSTGQHADSAESLRTQLAGAGVECAMERVPEVQVWREEWGRGGAGLGVGAVSRIASWLN